MSHKIITILWICTLYLLAAKAQHAWEIVHIHCKPASDDLMHAAFWIWIHHHWNRTIPWRRLLRREDKQKQISPLIHANGTKAHFCVSTVLASRCDQKLERTCACSHIYKYTRFAYFGIVVQVKGKTGEFRSAAAHLYIEIYVRREQKLVSAQKAAFVLLLFAANKWM